MRAIVFAVQEFLGSQRARVGSKPLDRVAPQRKLPGSGQRCSDKIGQARSARGVVLTGNTFWMGYEHNLLVEDSCAIVVGPNNFDRNPRYDLRAERRDAGTIVFRNSRDCTLVGLHICGARGEPAAVSLERCDRMQVADCMILDSDGAGLRLHDVTRSRVAGGLIRDDRAKRPRAPSLIITGGRDMTKSCGL